VGGAARSKDRGKQPPTSLSAPSPIPPPKRLETASNREDATHGGSVEENGAAAGPLVGARVHPMGERAAVVRPGGGAQNACPARRRGGELRLFKPCTAAGQPAQRRWPRG
jgi:hypothetical protein